MMLVSNTKGDPLTTTKPSHSNNNIVAGRNISNTTKHTHMSSSYNHGPSLAPENSLMNFLSRAATARWTLSYQLGLENFIDAMVAGVRATGPVPLIAHDERFTSMEQNYGRTMATTATRCGGGGGGALSPTTVQCPSELGTHVRRMTACSLITYAYLTMREVCPGRCERITWLLSQQLAHVWGEAGRFFYAAQFSSTPTATLAREMFLKTAQLTGLCLQRPVGSYGPSIAVASPPHVRLLCAPLAYRFSQYFDVAPPPTLIVRMAPPAPQPYTFTLPLSLPSTAATSETAHLPKHTTSDARLRIFTSKRLNDYRLLEIDDDGPNMHAASIELIQEHVRVHHAKRNEYTNALVGSPMEMLAYLEGQAILEPEFLLEQLLAARHRAINTKGGPVACIARYVHRNVTRAIETRIRGDAAMKSLPPQMLSLMRAVEEESAEDSESVDNSSETPNHRVLRSRKRPRRSISESSFALESADESEDDVYVVGETTTTPPPAPKRIKVV